MTARLTLVMAIACGVAVANIYFSQPLLAVMEAGFPRDAALVGFVPTATQLGYAAGIALLVPLGDHLERRGLILAQFGALGIVLAVVALAPNAAALVLASILVGAAATVAQQVVPFAAELAEPSRRGATIGTVMSGLLGGILLGRALAGIVGAHFGWRAIFFVAVVLAAVTAALLAATLPRSRPAAPSSYGTLLRSLARLWRDEPRLRRATVVQACLFGSFSVFWTILALELGARLHLGAAVAGAFGLVGAVGIFIAPLAGRIADRHGPDAVIASCGVVMLGSWLVFGAAPSLAGLIAGVVLLDFGEQGALIANQHAIYALRAEARNRVNTIFVGGMFLGGAFGSAGATLAWRLGGWIATCATGALLVAFALVADRFPRLTAGPSDSVARTRRSGSA